MVDIMSSITVDTGEGVISCPDPAVTNPLQSTGFNLQIVKFPELSFWCKSVTLPTITLGEAQQETPFMAVYIPGTRPEFTTLNITFTVDADMSNYTAINDWITLIGFAESTDDLNQWKQKYPENETGIDPNSPRLTSDGTIVVYGANQMPVRAITFRDLFPVSLDGFEINEETTETTYITATASFRFVGKPLISNRLTLK